MRGPYVREDAVGCGRAGCFSSSCSRLYQRCRPTRATFLQDGHFVPLLPPRRVIPSRCATCCLACPLTDAFHPTRPWRSGRRKSSSFTTVRCASSTAAARSCAKTHWISFFLRWRDQEIFSLTLGRSSTVGASGSWLLPAARARLHPSSFSRYRKLPRQAGHGGFTLST
jgi:hypothetical protein